MNLSLGHFFISCHTVLAELMTANDILIDMFSGCGMYTVPLGELMEFVGIYLMHGIVNNKTMITN